MEELYEPISKYQSDIRIKTEELQEQIKIATAQIPETLERATAYRKVYELKKDILALKIELLNAENQLQVSGIDNQEIDIDAASDILSETVGEVMKGQLEYYEALLKYSRWGLSEEKIKFDQDKISQIEYASSYQKYLSYMKLANENIDEIRARQEINSQSEFGGRN